MARACAARQAKQKSSTVSTSCWISAPKHLSAQGGGVQENAVREGGSLVGALKRHEWRTRTFRQSRDRQPR